MPFLQNLMDDTLHFQMWPLEICGIPIVHEETLKAAREAQIDPLSWVLYGGEDYELVGTVSSSDWDLLKGALPAYFKKIGVVSSVPGVFVERSTGERLAVDMSQTFQHLKAGD